jgi:hypothetical protein
MFANNYLIFVCLILTIKTTLQWAARLDGTGSEEVNGVAIDSSSNIVVTGYYNSNPLQIYNSAIGEGQRSMEYAARQYPPTTAEPQRIGGEYATWSANAQSRRRIQL